MQEFAQKTIFVAGRENIMLIENPKGNFKFIKGRVPFSLGAVADSGYEVVHVTLNPLPALAAGFDLVENHLHGLGRPLNALCGMELRIPKPLSYQGFVEFNQGYIEKLTSWKVHVGDLNPVARTNVAIEVEPVPGPSLYGFSFTVPSHHQQKTFVLSGVPELKPGGIGEREVVAPGDITLSGMHQKVDQVLASVTALLQQVPATWADPTTIDIYTVHDFHPLLETTVLRRIKSANLHGIHWHYARPPVSDSEFEMDVRRVVQELILAG